MAGNTCCDEHCVTSTQRFFGIALHVVVAACCIALAIMNRVDYLEYNWLPGDGPSASSPFFHRVIATDFRKQTSEFEAQVRCPLVFGNNTAADEPRSRGVDSLCTCLMRKAPGGNDAQNVQQCLEIDGAMPVYVLHYAGVIPSADYVLWAFLCITASCLTSFSRMQGYPNLLSGYRWIMPFWVAVINLCVVCLNFWVWAGDSEGFETADNQSDRRDVPETCDTIRFVFAFILFGWMLHLPHTLTQMNVPGFGFPDGFLMQGYVTDINLKLFRTFMYKHNDKPHNQNIVGWDSDSEGREKLNGRPYKAIQSDIYACELNQRDEQFRIGFWQAVSEDANFTTGGMLLAVVFSAHAGVHDDSTLLVDVCCVGGVGFLQHMSHVLMLVKEYVYQDSNEDHTSGGIGNEDDMTADMEKRVCEHIGNTRVMIHFFVFSLVVFYCNRTAPSTFEDSELKNFFEVARFSVILALLACNTMYDIFFEVVHVLKHMTEAGPAFGVNPYDFTERTPYAAKVSFLAYHAQYRGPYLWRVHLLLPFMLFFAAIIFFQQALRPSVNIEARVTLG